MLVLAFYLTLALVVSFLCSLAEATLLSVRPTYVASLERDSRGAQALRALRANLDRPLAAILTLNTIAHTVGAAGVGAQATRLFGSQYLGWTSAILTLLILVFSEIIPKTLGAAHWKRLAPGLGIAINWLTGAMRPFVWLSERITRVIGQTGAAQTFSRDEMEAMARIGAREGVIEDQQLNIVRNLLRLDRLSVRDVMTPRTVVFSLPASMQVREFFDRHADAPFSRVPIIGSHDNQVIGYVLKGDIVAAQAADEFERRLEEFSRELLTIPATLSASHAFDRLIREDAHLALVVDEYGSTRGLLTLEDLLETLIGLEIVDELDTVEDMQALARKRWRERMRRLGIDPDSLREPPVG